MHVAFPVFIKVCVDKAGFRVATAVGAQNIDPVIRIKKVRRVGNQRYHGQSMRNINQKGFRVRLAAQKPLFKRARPHGRGFVYGNGPRVGGAVGRGDRAVRCVVNGGAGVRRLHGNLLRPPVRAGLRGNVGFYGKPNGPAAVGGHRRRRLKIKKSIGAILTANGHIGGNIAYVYPVHQFLVAVV